MKIIVSCLSTGATGAAALAALLVATGCGRQPQMPAPPPPAVTVAPPVQREVVEWDEFTGRIEAVETVEVRARVGGQLLGVHFEDGAGVKQGDLLFTIDPATFEAELARAVAEVRRSQAQLDQAKAELARAGQLRESNTISPQEYDNWTRRVSELEAAVMGAEAAAKSAQLRLGYTRVTSPISGRVSRRLVTPGNLISEPPFAPTLLTTVVTEDPVHCYVDVDERTLLKYHALQQSGERNGKISAELALADEAGFPHKGSVDFVDNRVDPDTGTIRLRAVFPNPHRKLTPGLFARVRIPGSAPYTTLMIPETALGADQGLKLVFLVGQSNIVEPRPVTVGPVLDGLRVIRSGLAPADQVIVNGQARVRPGMPVTPEPQKAAVASAR
jgi:RND family efflux transporter MFP subunit